MCGLRRARGGRGRELRCKSVGKSGMACAQATIEIIRARRVAGVLLCAGTPGLGQALHLGPVGKPP
eukprot:10260912-Lingulodinium_polyedra.AAC.1